jgi:hypothetical protein
VSTIRGKIRLEQNLFCFLLKGTKCVHYAGELATIGPAQFFLLTAGQCLMTEKIAGTGGQYRSTLIFFDNQLLADFLVSHPGDSANRTAGNTTAPFLVFDKDPFLVNFIESLGLCWIPDSLYHRKCKR